MESGRYPIFRKVGIVQAKYRCSSDLGQSILHKRSRSLAASLGVGDFIQVCYCLKFLQKWSSAQGQGTRMMWPAALP